MPQSPHERWRAPNVELVDRDPGDDLTAVVAGKCPASLRGPAERDEEVLWVLAVLVVHSYWQIAQR